VLSPVGGFAASITVALCIAMRDSVTKDLSGSPHRALRNIVRPRASMTLTIAATSGALILAGCSAPKLGKILRSRRRRVELRWRELFPSFQCSNHWLATVANEWLSNESLAVRTRQDRKVLFEKVVQPLHLGIERNHSAVQDTCLTLKLDLTSRFPI
jgi:hypothetical protein